jgi:uncharacterized membrane protein HdeD (DUF308 family)
MRSSAALRLTKSLDRRTSLAEVFVASSKQIAAILGPTMVVMLVAEFPLVQPHLYDSQTPPVVYLSGVLMFIAGLVIIRAHNIWARNWTVLVTFSGWFFLLLGLLRVFFASQYRQVAPGTSSWVLMLFEGLLLVVALFITFKGYSRGGS